MPPITAAISTPNAPTPPLSSGAGGVENDDPEGFAEEDVVDVDLADALAPDEAEADVAPAPVLAVRGALEDAGVDFGAPDCADVPVPGVLVEDDVPAGAAAAAPAAVLLPVEVLVPGAPGFAPVGRVLSGLLSAGFGSDDAVAPVLGIPEDGEPAPALPAFSFTFSALRSIVTGRFALAPDAVDGLSPLPGLSAEPDPLPPDEDAPPEDFLSVAICSPPEPSGHTIHT
ncbi:hypothetical protein [Roseibium sp.]|uniref:hypothetical protein n=1 Tax=Roseibium sp. TaxID=1936156 RepID=UPI003BAC3186